MVRSTLARQVLPLIQVLLVEDNPSDAFLVENLLGDSNIAEYKTHCVKTQSSAIEALATQSYDVCLLDLTLPDATGFSALIDIQEKAPDMPVLVLTGMNDMALAKGAVSRGAQDYLLKDEMEMTGLSRSINYAMERKRLEKELFQRANCDSLTGLSNREAFLNRLHMAIARAERTGMGIGVLFIDLDRFKPINDLQGHDAGDEVLRIVATRIKEVLRPYDTPARFGGDEFAVLLENMYNSRDAAYIARKIVKEISAAIPYHHLALEVSASIGVAFSYAPAEAEMLLHHADTAMYHAKRDGGCAYRFYADSMHEETLERLSLEEKLLAALQAKELRLYYQPFITPNGEAIVGVEALLRWAHPERGLLSAHEFIPAAEAARLMPEITEWICKQLREDIAVWNEQALPPLSVAINLSVSQLDSSDVVEQLASVADKKLLGGHKFAVEIPEEAMSSLSQKRFLTIGKISALGIDLHLDHFGRGSLSLTALHSLPFSLLKLDMSLIKNMKDEVDGDVLIRAAIMLAHHLGMKAGAVGVESPWQAKILQSQSCDLMQGYLTMHPMSAEQLADWIKPKYG